jgi:hypothetical protein
MKVTREIMQTLLYDILRESKLSKDAKIQLGLFVKEADAAQLKALFLDGEMVALDEQAAAIVDQRMENRLKKDEHLREIFEFAGVLNSLDNKMIADYKVCKKEKCHKQGILGAARTYCTNACWVKVLDSSQRALKSLMNRCNNARNPEKCKERVNKTIARHKAAQAKYQEKANKAKSQMAK